MKKLISLILCLSFILTPTVNIHASDNTIDRLTECVAASLIERIDEPQVGSVGGEWLVIGLARSNIVLPENYLSDYLARVEKYVKEKDGVLHKKKYTEYSRVILALTSIGADPTNVGGYDLTSRLGEFDNVCAQGINGAIWALTALDSSECDTYGSDKDAGVKLREKYIDYILEHRLNDGGWSLSEKVSDIDVTAMALQALSRYKNRSDVEKAIDDALTFLSNSQAESGGFSSKGVENSESCAQVIIALCELDISLDDARFVKSGHTVLDAMLSFLYEDSGFKHTKSSSQADQMASEQCLCALAALKRRESGFSSLYDMRDVSSDVTLAEYNKFPSRIREITVRPVTRLDMPFDDIYDSEAREYIEILYSREIINGKSETVFDPMGKLTRAEFATLIVRALGLSTSGEVRFNDVTESEWFFDFVNTAAYYGIVNGVSENIFFPYSLVTREEAATMIMRAAKLCGMSGESSNASIRDTLSVFSDYVTSASWARDSLAFCVSNKIISDEETTLRPKEELTRADISKMLCALLSAAELLN